MRCVRSGPAIGQSIPVAGMPNVRRHAVERTVGRKQSGRLLSDDMKGACNMALTYIMVAIFSTLIALFIYSLNAQTLDVLHAQRRRQRFMANASAAELTQMDEHRKRQKMVLGKTAKVIGLIGALFFALTIYDIFATSPSTSNSRGTCGYCHKSYSITSSDGRNISRTHLCNSCYAFMDSATKVLGN